MKNIYIYGMPRTGKTSLATCIAKKFPNYHIINLDAIREAFLEIFPEDINYKEKIGLQDKFPAFLRSYIKNEEEWNRGSFSYIIEGYDITPESIVKFFPEYLKYGLFYNDTTTSSMLLEAVKKYDSSKDWSFYKNDDFMLAFLEKYIQRNSSFMQRANENGIKCFKTTSNRTEVFQKILDDISSNM